MGSWRVNRRKAECPLVGRAGTILALTFAVVGALALSSCTTGTTTSTHGAPSPVGSKRAGATKAGSSATGSTKPTSSPTTSAGAGSTGVEPVLDAAVLDAPGTAGYGQVRPSLIAVSGAGATRRVDNIVWTSWGSASATGTGTGCVLAATGIEANCTVTPATVVVYDLASCSGTPAYLEVAWYFPSLGQSFTPSTNPAPPTATCGTSTGSPPPGPTSTVPPVPTTVPSTVPTTSVPPAAPCTASIITTVVKAATTNFYRLTGYGCTGNFAYAFVTVTATGQPVATVTQLLKATHGAWQEVNRGQYCTQNLVPVGIYPQACETQ